MDNLTHTLIGAAVAETADAWFLPGKTLPPGLPRRKLFFLASILGNNFPDLDFLYSGITGGKLGYLLHHRGHTHTLVGLLPQALLIWIMLPLFFSRKSYASFGTKEKRWAGGLIIGGLLLHLFADSWNSYGIHPFYPFDSRWFYGDAIFILEPIIWVILACFVGLQARTKWPRWALLIAILGLLGFLVLGGGITALTLLGLTFFCVLTLGFMRTLTSRRRSLAAWGLTLCFILGMNAISLYTKALIRTQWHKDFEESRLFDLALTPAPANPFCWSFVTAETDRNEHQYKSLRGIVNLLPDWLDSKTCPFFQWTQIPHTQGLTPPRAMSPEITLISSFEMDFNSLREMANSQCTVKAWLKFGRMPIVAQNTISDLRFSWRGSKNFSEVRLDDLPCPEWVPSWLSPRSDLFSKALADRKHFR